METKVICITGGMGSGKSTVCALLEQRAFPVYNSDLRAKDLMEHNPEVVNALSTLFSSDAYVNGRLNKTLLAAKIFRSPNLKKSLEAIVHPAVREDFNIWLESQNTKVVFKESALAIEVEDGSCDTIVSVMADRQLRIARVLSRNTDWSLEHVLERMNNQISDQERKEKSDFLLLNDGDLKTLEGELDQLLTKLKVI